MLTAGAVYDQPDENPAGNSAGSSSRRSASRPAHAGGDSAARATTRPCDWCTPADGSSASAVSTSRPVFAHA